MRDEQAMLLADNTNQEFRYQSKCVHNTVNNIIIKSLLRLCEVGLCLQATTVSQLESLHLINESNELIQYSYITNLANGVFVMLLL